MIVFKEECIYNLEEMQVVTRHKMSGSPLNFLPYFLSSFFKILPVALMGKAGKNSM